MKKPRIISCFVLVMTALLLTACGGLPSDMKKQAEEVAAGFDAAGAQIASQKDKYTQLKKSEQFKVFAVYAERENWDAFFVEAESELSRARSIYDSKIKPILDKNEKEDASALATEIGRLRRVVKGAIKTSKKAAERIAFLQKVSKEAPGMVKTAEKEMARINHIIASLDVFIAKAKTDYPKKAEDIKGRYMPLQKLQKEARDALAIAHAEFKAHKSNYVADYAKLGDSTVCVTANLKKLEALDKSLRSKIGELYLSYSKILMDMRVEYYVKIGRVSWDDYSDFATEHQYLYSARKVNSDVYEYFANLSVNTVPAKYSTSWGKSYDISVDKAKWQVMNIAPKEAWPSSSDDHSEFWVEDTFMKTYHKYLLVQDGERKETDWVEIDEEDYEDNLDNLGMEIVSKPYGYYESEKLEEAAPPGMAYVGNPKYGKWETNAQGQRQWGWFEYYMFYHMMFGGNNYYSHNSWSTWNRDYRGRDAYYGKTKAGGQKFGTCGSKVQKSTRFNKTKFAKGGGFKRANASVRGAGSSHRGGGPGGRGK